MPGDIRVTVRCGLKSAVRLAMPAHLFLPPRERAQVRAVYPSAQGVFRRKHQSRLIQPGLDLPQAAEVIKENDPSKG
jgi:hypothetical protein